VLDDCSLLVQSVVHAPNLVVVHTSAVGDALFKATQSLAEVSPLPALVLTQDDDADHIVRATESGMHAYVINRYGAQRLPPLMQLAQARFGRERALMEELRDVSTRFEDRKAVERAKGILMSARKLPDNDAFHILRTASGTETSSPWAAFGVTPPAGKPPRFRSGSTMWCTRPWHAKSRCALKLPKSFYWRSHAAHHARSPYHLSKRRSTATRPCCGNCCRSSHPCDARHVPVSAATAWEPVPMGMSSAPSFPACGGARSNCQPSRTLRFWT